MAKYVSNAFHALKVSFTNEVGTLAKQLGVDTETVMRIFTSDTRLNISRAYLSPALLSVGRASPKICALVRECGNLRLRPRRGTACRTLFVFIARSKQEGAVSRTVFVFIARSEQEGTASRTPTGIAA